MEKEQRRTEEDRELPRVTEDRLKDADPDGGKERPEGGWLESGAEDPAFFIKPSDGE